MSEKPVRSNGGTRRNGAEPVTRAEFDGVIKLLHARGEMIEELRREVAATCRDLGEGVRRELQTQLTRIAQIQQELDELKRRIPR